MHDDSEPKEFLVLAPSGVTSVAHRQQQAARLRCDAEQLSRKVLVFQTGGHSAEITDVALKLDFLLVSGCSFHLEFYFWSLPNGSADQPRRGERFLRAEGTLRGFAAERAGCIGLILIEASPLRQAW